MGEAKILLFALKKNFLKDLLKYKILNLKIIEQERNSTYHLLKLENGSQTQQHYPERAFQEGLAESREDLVRSASQEDPQKEHQKGASGQSGAQTNRQTQAHRQMPDHQVQQEAASGPWLHFGRD